MTFTQGDVSCEQFIRKDNLLHWKIAIKCSARNLGNLIHFCHAQECGGCCMNENIFEQKQHDTWNIHFISWNVIMSEESFEKSLDEKIRGMGLKITMLNIYTSVYSKLMRDEYLRYVFLPFFLFHNQTKEMSNLDSCSLSSLVTYSKIFFRKHSNQPIIR